LAKIQIVSKDFQGPIRNGGVGTAFFEYALVLSKKHQVECILTCPENFIEEPGFQFWKKKYDEYKNITLTLLDEKVPESYINGVNLFSQEIKRAYRAYLYIKNTNPDIVIYGDYGADGFFLTKDISKSYETICVVHGTTFWGKLENSESLTDQNDYLLFDAEMSCITDSDHTIFPSRYIHEWHKRFAIREVKNPIYICNPYKVSENTKSTTKKINSVFYFGRLEHRKGIDIYLESIAKLKPHQDIKKYILGKLGAFDSGSVLALLTDKLSKIDETVEIKTSLNSKQCIDYIKSKNGLVVFPSRADNCPLTVLECIKNGIPIFVSNTGGQAELLDERFSSTNIFPNTAGELAELIEGAINNGATVPELSQFARNADLHLDQFIEKLNNKPKNFNTQKNKVTSTICIPTLNKDKLRTFKLLEKVLRWKLPVVLVNDGGVGFDSEQMMFFNSKNIRYVTIKNSYPGKARNIAAELAETTHLLFIDDDNIPSDNMYDRYLEYAQMTNVDIVSSWFYVHNSETNAKQYIQAMLGLSGHSDLFDNKISDNNILIRKSIFNQCGGYPVQWGVGYEDYALLRNSIKNGANVYVIPEPLFVYKMTAGGVNNSSNITAGFYSLLLNEKNLRINPYEIFVASLRAKQLIGVNKKDHRPDIHSSFESAVSAMNLTTYNIWSLLVSFISDSDANLPFLDGLLTKWVMTNLHNGKEISSKYNLFDVLNKLYGDRGLLNSNQIIVYSYLWLFLKTFHSELLDDDLERIKDVGKDGKNNLAKIINLLKIDAYVDASRNLNILFKTSEISYLLEYPDIASGVKEGVFQAGFNHFLKVYKDEPWRKYNSAGIIFLANKILESSRIK